MLFFQHLDNVHGSVDAAAQANGKTYAEVRDYVLSRLPSYIQKHIDENLESIISNLIQNESDGASKELGRQIAKEYDLEPVFHQVEWLEDINEVRTELFTEPELASYFAGVAGAQMDDMPEVFQITRRQFGQCEDHVDEFLKQNGLDQYDDLTLSELEPEQILNYLRGLLKLKGFTVHYVDEYHETLGFQDKKTKAERVISLKEGLLILDNEGYATIPYLMGVLQG